MTATSQLVALGRVFMPSAAMSSASVGSSMTTPV
jgi:hypothetical protein